MSPEQIDVIVRVAGATLLILAALLRLGRGARGDDLYFVPLALCLSGFLAGNTPVSALRLSGGVGHVGVLLSGFAAVFLWWFCLAVFDRAFRPRGPVLVAGLAWILIAAADRGVFGPDAAGRGLSWLLIALGLGMVGHLAWRLLRDRAGDLIDHRRRSRVAVVILLAGQLLADMAVDVLLGMDWQPLVFAILQNAALVAFTAWLLWLDLRVQPAPVAFVVPADGVAPEPQPDPARSRLETRLRALIEVERAHLDPDLTFETFVLRMGASERAVRRLINHQLGYDHFRTFLNRHRVDEAKRRLASPAHRGDKLIVIAMDSGFASLPSFNRAFQQFEGVSPGAFRRGAEIGSPAPGTAGMR
jgi:AraC-like DNA-binding protein